MTATFPMRFVWTAAALVLLAAAVLWVTTGTAFAQATDPFAMVTTKGSTTITRTMPILRLVAIGCIIAAAAVGMVMRGKFPFGWIFSIVGGLLMIAVAAGFADWFMTMGT